MSDRLCFATDLDVSSSWHWGSSPIGLGLEIEVLGHKPNLILEVLDLGLETQVSTLQLGSCHVSCIHHEYVALVYVY